jgi:hypothetical protein
MRRSKRFGDRTSGMPERRASHRFPLRLPIRYRMIGSSRASSEWVSTESVNISSGGLFFRTAEAVPPGQSLEAFVAWPLRLDKHIPLRLVTRGPVIRNDGIGTAMRFETYEFRTSQIHAEAHSIPGNLQHESEYKNDSSLKAAV